MLQARDGALTNFEVLQLLESQADARLAAEQALPLPGARRGTAATTSWSSEQSVVTISEQVLGYLRRPEIGCASQSHERIAAFIAATVRFKLTSTEVISLVNAQPGSIVEIHLIVEECEERLTPEQVQELLDLCGQISEGAADASASGDQPRTPISS